MIVNGLPLFHKAPIRNMIPEKRRAHGASHGLGEAGYDITLKQAVAFYPQGASYESPELGSIFVEQDLVTLDGKASWGRFTIASAVEEFDMPEDLVGIVHDKSTWARQGLSVFNTVIEPGWKGYLTLELVYHGSMVLVLPAGVGIAQILFHKIQEPSAYDGKYQHQADEPVPAILR